MNGSTEPYTALGLELTALVAENKRLKARITALEQQLEELRDAHLARGNHVLDLEEQLALARDALRAYEDAARAMCKSDEWAEVIERPL